MPVMTLYVDRNSWIHRMPGEPKMALILLCFLPLVFYNPLLIAAVYALLFVIAFSARVLTHFVKETVLIVPLAVSIFMFQTFFANRGFVTVSGIGPDPGSFQPIGQLAWGPFRLEPTWGGLYHAMWLSLTILLISGVVFLTLLVTHPGDIFYVLKSRFHVPYFFSFVVLNTLQIVPSIDRVSKVILEAQRSRGFEGGRNPFKLQSLLVPLFVSSMERTLRTAMSIESRGFGSSNEKTSLRVSVMNRSAYLMAGVIFAAMIASVGVRILYGTFNWSSMDYFYQLTRMLQFSISRSITWQAL